LKFLCLLSGSISCQIYNTRAVEHRPFEIKGKRAARANVFHLPGAMRKNRRFCLILVGAHRAGETPVPMPNTEVKPRIGYNTWVLALGK
jgi:hypothetical protein